VIILVAGAAINGDCENLLAHAPKSSVIVSSEAPQTGEQSTAATMALSIRPIWMGAKHSLFLNSSLEACRKMYSLIDDLGPDARRAPGLRLHRVRSVPFACQAESIVRVGQPVVAPTGAQLSYLQSASDAARVRWLITGSAPFELPF